MQLVGSDLPYFSADAPNWCVSLIHRQPRGQNRNQAGRSCNDLEIGAEAFQVIQMKIDTGGYSDRSEEHTSELQSLMRISYAVFCLNKKNNTNYDNKKTITCKNIV